MTTLTDKELIKEIKERISSLDVRDNIERRSYEIALASLEAEPIAYIFKHPAGKLFWALTDESNKDQSDVIPVYAAPPVPVVPAALPENDDEDGHDIDYLEPSEVYSLGRTAGWNACRAAMLHGAEPVSQTYKLNELSGNSPVTPDGWISCSERMPDTKTAVLVAVEFDRKGDWRMKWATYIPGHPDANDGWIIPGASWKPSHWMPLPEPPL
ncbi:DUF551 domain-containing protein [Escherichia coli]|nr:DUF551 domain-containing protein [Escherichia coli]MCH7127413.1 DUF551 domain-containing protein [Escherichia coli]MDM9134420.1 DUF551 domain-containing protein [Escherichia coli]WNU80915.1 DUF551 domain-containing protein [Escherichia coli]